MRRILLALVAFALVVPLTPSLPAEPPPGAPPLLAAKVYRDDFGVPHIFADTAYALYYANGYVQAHDRLFEMDVLRHVGRGNAAGVLGESLLASDVSARRELYTEAEREAKFATMSDHGRLVFQAFADGVNRAITEMTATGGLPAEFPALQHAPEPWTPIDTIAAADFLLDRFGTGGGGELGNAALLAHLRATVGDDAADEALRDLVWVRHPDAYATIPDSRFTTRLGGPRPLDRLVPDQAALLEPAARAEGFGVAKDLLPSPPGPQSGNPFGFDPARIRWGSNALLVAPALSATGEAMVGGGPQTGYFNPEVLYEVGLHGAGVDVVGVGVAAAPGVVLGRTGTFAWTVTSGISDQEDIVALPAAGERSYRWDGETIDLDCRTEVHTVFTPPAAGQAAPRVLTQEVCVSDEGPVRAVTLDADGAPEVFWAVRKAHRDLEMVGAEKWLSIDSATNLRDFRRAFDGFPFTFNFNYAGPEGACYHHVGTQPLRARALDPRFPTPPGDAYEWRGFLTGAQLPRACNPDQGYFANWNNLPQAGWPSGDGRELWGSLHRVERLDREMRDALAADADGRLALEDVQGILRAAATHDSFAAEVGPAIVAAVDEVAPGDPAIGEIRAAFVAWETSDFAWRDANGDGFYDDAGHNVYDALLPPLLDAVLGDELGPHAKTVNFDPSTDDDPHAGDHGEHQNPFAVLLDTLAGRSRHDWFDDVETAGVESRAETLRAALADVAHELEFDAGKTAADLADTLPVHESKFTAIGAGPAYTMPMTNRATYYHFHVGVDTARSLSALPPGQSGHLTPLDLLDIVANGGQGPIHMRDQLPLYNEFRFKVVPVTEAQADAVSADPPTTLLVPPPLP